MSQDESQKRITSTFVNVIIMLNILKHICRIENWITFPINIFYSDAYHLLTGFKGNMCFVEHENQLVPDPITGSRY